MAINKYGNDFKNNIMWNKEYPFIPEITNDDGFTIHEGDICEYYNKYRNKFCAVRVYKIYNKDFIWTREISPENIIVSYDITANKLLPHVHSCKPPKFEDFGNDSDLNWLDLFLGSVYSHIYPEELNSANDWHFDEDKFNAKRLEEVAKLKNKY